jgi:hypothetical protein
MSEIGALDVLRQAAKRTGKSVVDLVRAAVRCVWIQPESSRSKRAHGGPVALWNGTPKRTSADHDAIYDEP